MPFSGEVQPIRAEEILSRDAMASRKSPGRSINALNLHMSGGHNINDPNIQAKIGNRMTKTINKTIGEFRLRTTHNKSYK